MSWKDVPIRSATARIALSLVKGLGPVTLSKIVEAHSTLGEVVEAASRASSEGVKGTPFTSRVVALLADAHGVARLMDDAAADMDAVTSEGGSVLSPDDDDYPRLLRGLEAAPVIRVYGQMPADDVMTVATVGTRYPNRFGVAVCNKVTSFLVANGVVPVSGMAVGVDRICHDRAMADGGCTVAVIAGGLGGIDPADRRYAVSVVEAGGAVVTQFRHDERVSVSNLLSRNDTVAGLSLGMVCLQGSRETGGTRKAMSDAVSQGKPVFVPVPPAGFEDPERDVLVDLVRGRSLSEEYVNLSHLLSGSGDFPSMLGRIRREWEVRSEPCRDVAPSLGGQAAFRV